MPPPFALAVDSDDSDDGGGGPSAPMTISHLGLSTPPAADPNAYELSQTGAFKLADFQLRPAGGLTKVGDDDSLSPEKHAHPEDLIVGTSVPKLDVSSISDLEVLSELGSGASGIVYKARHRSSGTLVAVKCVKILEKPKRDQIVAELRIMMSHAAGGAGWLVTLHNAFYEEAQVYTVLEFMDAGSLEDRVKEHAAAGGLHDEYELVKIARPLLSGLNYLHRQLHQIHRDLKPANVMCSSSGAVKIADFGISKALESTADLAETQVGTTCYMSPERLLAESYSYSADIWAFGLIMLELATGSFPYPAENYFALLGHIQDNDPPTLPARCGLSSALADPVEGLVALCLDKQAARRPSARDLLRHPWLRQAEAREQRTHDARDPRLDRSGGGCSTSSRSSPGSLDRSRSNLQASLDELELSGVLGDMSGMKLTPGE
jgi:serine/threonine protein kinase